VAQQVEADRLAIHLAPKSTSVAASVLIKGIAVHRVGVPGRPTALVPPVTPARWREAALRSLLRARPSVASVIQWLAKDR